MFRLVLCVTSGNKTERVDFHSKPFHAIMDSTRECISRKIFQKNLNCVCEWKMLCDKRNSPIRVNFRLVLENVQNLYFRKKENVMLKLRPSNWFFILKIDVFQIPLLVWRTFFSKTNLLLLFFCLKKANISFRKWLFLL